jgi:hypothetical protein
MILNEKQISDLISGKDCEACGTEQASCAVYLTADNTVCFFCQSCGRHHIKNKRGIALAKKEN